MINFQGETMNKIKTNPAAFQALIKNHNEGPVVMLKPAEIQRHGKAGVNAAADC